MVSPSIFSVSAVESDKVTCFLLFILSLEILACYIRQDRNIHGLVINDEEIRLTLFADDVPCCFRDRVTYFFFFFFFFLFASICNSEIPFKVFCSARK